MIRNITHFQNICKEQSDEIKIEECNIEFNAAKYNPNLKRYDSIFLASIIIFIILILMYSFSRKLMKNEEIDFPLKHIKHMKNINVYEISKNQDEAKMVLEIALETIAEQAKKIQRLQIQRCKLKNRVQNLTELNKQLHDNNF